MTLLLPLIAAVLLLAGCAVPTMHVEPERATDFTAHLESTGLVIDHGTDGRRVLTRSLGWLTLSGDTDIELDSTAGAIAELSMPNADHLTVHPAAPGASRCEHVDTSWKDGFLRLQLRTLDGRRYTTSRFRRIDSRDAADALSDQMRMAAVDGSYRAILRDGSGAQVGWLRLRLDRDGHPVSRIYDGSIPPSIDPALVDAAIVLLNRDIGMIGK